MSGYGNVYVIDNNALSFLGREHRASDYFTAHCRIPSEVLHEAEGFPDFEELKRLEYPTTPSVLARLIEVMARVPVGDTKLVNLYANLGNADPLVIATAVDGQRRDAAALFSPTWTVVSGDKAVQAKAGEFGLPVKTNQEFLAVLEAHMANASG
ncbi:hypothetical protein [Sinomonas mesophila]|uniref:hypothetical protein n=1 Tax=Sinomonas mesophila TaxID=1531955 RepID=UPI000984A31E|nr:hypothetical protein [Sinomonas mesophila]